VHGQPDAFDRVPHLSAQPCTLCGRDGPDLVGALEDEDVPLSGQGKGIGAANADGAAADDDDLG
jgi:hypothetical protein